LQAGPAANCCRADFDESRAALVAAPILRFVSGKTFFNPDDLDGH